MKLLALAAASLLALDGAAGLRAGAGAPFALGMEKDVALTLAGPDAVAGVLCGGIDAVMVERAGASVMAGFRDGRVAEIEALEAPATGCGPTFARAYANALGRWGAPLGPVEDAESGTARLRRVEFAVRGGIAELVERRFPGGACDVRLLVRGASV